MTRTSRLALWAAGLTTIALGAGVAHALEIGDQAPPLAVSEWLQGAPTNPAAADGEHVYLAVFWASWAGGTRAAVPPLAKLHEQFADDGLVIVAISAEQNNVERVKQFVARRSDRIKYRVAIDDRTLTQQRYLAEEEQEQLPLALLIDSQGRVVWKASAIDDLRDVVRRTLAGDFELDEARQLAAERDARRRRLQELGNAYLQAMMRGERFEQARAAGRAYVEFAGDDASALGALAEKILINPELRGRDLGFAVELTTRANALTDGRDPIILNTHARALFERGRYGDALRLQEAAVERAYDEDLRAELQQVLNEYRGRIKAMIR